MGSVNKVIILGYLGQDPEIKSTPNGTQVCTISVATSDKYTKDGKTEEKTEWHRVVLWGKQAELASKYLRKGRQVYLEGKLQTRSWETTSGEKRYTTEIIGSSMVFIDSGKTEVSESDGPAIDYGSQEAPKKNTNKKANDFMDIEDIPF